MEIAEIVHTPRIVGFVYLFEKLLIRVTLDVRYSFLSFWILVMPCAFFTTEDDEKSKQCVEYWIIEQFRLVGINRTRRAEIRR